MRGEEEVGGGDGQEEEEEGSSPAPFYPPGLTQHHSQSKAGDPFPTSGGAAVHFSCKQ